MTTESIQNPEKKSRFRFRDSLLWTLIMILIPLVLIPAILMGGAVYFRSRNLLLDQINGQLTNLTDQEVTAFHDWIGNKEVWLSDIVLETDFINAAAELVQQTPVAGQNSGTGEQVLSQLEEVGTSVGIPLFDQFLFVDLDGNVIASSSEQWVGMNISDQDYFNQNFLYNVTDSAFLIQPEPFYSADNEQPAVYQNYEDYSNEIILMTSTYINGIYGEKIGYLVGVSESSSIQRIAENTLAVVPGSQLFIVLEDKYCGILARQGFVFADPSSEQQNVVLNTPEEGAEAQTYSTFDGTPVIGYYSYSRALETGLLIEISQELVLGPVQSLAPFIIGVLILALVLIAILTYAVVKNRFLDPLEEVVQVTESFATGDWQVRSPVTSSDEIGVLASSFNEMADQLSDLYQSLESQVKERTTDLVQRANYLATIAEISRTVTEIYNMDDLLSSVTHLISDKFNFYHVGIFLLDEEGEYAVLRAANSEGGWRMLSRQHKLKVGEQGIVGYVTGSRKPRVLQRVGDDEVYFDNPDLPLTRSEMSLPLVIGGQILGALDVQSTEENAFSDEDVEVLQVLADNVTMAIRNTQLFEQLEERLESERRSYSEFSRAAWQQILESGQGLIGFRSDERTTRLIEEVTTDEFTQMALQNQQTVFSDTSPDGEFYPLAMPIRVRGEMTAALLETKKKVSDGPWTSEEVEALEAIGEQISIALENARLYEESQRLAQRERIAAEVAGKVWSSSDVNTILQTAVQELSRALNVSQGIIQLKVPSQGRDVETKTLKMGESLE